MKRFLSIVLLVTLCFSLFVVPANAAEDATKKFTDIKGHWAKKDIEKMAEKGIINGISDTEFAPDRVISRVEFLALVVRAMGVETADYTDAYADVKGNEWYANTVQTGKNLGLIDSAMTPDNKFDATAPINREEMTSLIIRAYEAKAKETAPKGDISVFTDKDKISSWATRYVEGAYALTIIKGVSETEFSPKATATRAQAATIISRFLSDSKIGKTIKILSIGNSFSVDAMQWLYPLFESYGYDSIILGILYYSDCSLEKHNNFITNQTLDYTYKKNVGGKWTDLKEITADTVMKDEVWDTVVIGHAPSSSGNSNTFEPYLENIIQYVKANAINPDVTIGFHMTWAYPKDSTRYGYDYYNHDQLTMYKAIVSATKEKVISKKNVDYVIPVGTAIQNARTSYLGEGLTRDTCHLSEYVGRYIAALTWFTTITGTSIEDVTYVPNKVMIPEKMQQVAVESVLNTLKSPYSVTKSKITE